MVSDEALLEYIEEMLPKLTDKHIKLVDICLRLRVLLREKVLDGTDHKGPKRDRAAYMRGYRARKIMIDKPMG